VWFWLLIQGGCSRLVFRSLFRIKIQENSLCNVLREVEILFKGWFWWLIKGMMRSLKVLRTAKNSSQSMCLGWFVCGFCWLAFHEKIPSYLGTPKKLQQSMEVTRWLIQKRIMVLCKTFEAITEESGYVLFLVFMLCQVEGWCQEHWIMWYV
jgi:hypothetical protein